MHTRSAPPADPGLTPQAPTLGDRIRALRTELAALEQQQHADLRRLIATAFPGEVFSALQIWQQPELRRACLDADLATVQQLGLWLRTWCGRCGRDGAGAIWSVDANDLHAETSNPGADVV